MYIYIGSMKEGASRTVLQNERFTHVPAPAETGALLGSSAVMGHCHSGSTLVEWCVRRVEQFFGTSGACSLQPHPWDHAEPCAQKPHPATQVCSDEVAHTTLELPC